MIEETDAQPNEFQQLAQEAVTVVAAPKKRLRKLVKNQQVNSSPNDQNKSAISGGDFNSGRKDQEGDKPTKPKTPLSYLDQVQELAAQIADMDAQRERQMADTYNENEQNEESEEKVYFDESEEALIARITGSQSDGSSKKIKKEKKKDKKKINLDGTSTAGIEGGEVKEIKKKTKKQLVNLADIEKNEDMLKRLADKFDEAENEQEEVQEKGQFKDSEGYQGDTNIEKQQKKKQPKKESGVGMLQTKNKLFGEINAMEMNLDQIQEQPVEEECLNEQSMTFQRNQQRSSKHLISFLSHAVMYKKQRGLDFQTSESQLKDAQNHQSQENDATLGKGQSNEDVEKNQVTVDPTAPESGEQLTSENTIKDDKSKENNDTSNGEGSNVVLSQENITSSQVENNKPLTINSQERKLQLMRQSSLKLQKLISMQSVSSQQQRLSQEIKGENSIGLAGISQVAQEDDQLDIELHVPSVDKSARMNQLTNNTLFFNKVARGSQNDLFSTLSSDKDNNSNMFPLGKQTSKADSSISSNSKLDLLSNKSKDSIIGIGLDRKSSSQQSNLGQSLLKKKLSREEYLLKGQQRITERKSQGLNLEEVQKRFKQTTLKSLGEKNAAMEKEEKDKNKEGNNEDDDDEDDEDYEGEDKSDKEKRGNDNGSDKEEEEEDDDAFEEKKRQLIEAEIQYKKLLALEEGVDEKEFEKQIREEYGLEDDNEEDEEEDVEENEKPEEDLFENSNHDENQIIEEMAEQKHNPSSQINETETNTQIKPIKRLRNMASEIIRKEKEKEAAKKLRREKRERRRQLMNNPLMKKLMGDMIEDEAELGSDNEENDDKVKTIEGEDEHKQAGLAQGEDLDAELAELIDNVVEFDDENERAATAKFVRDLEKRDKQEIQKIIEGAYKGQRAQKRSLGGLLDEADGRTATQNENKKLKRIQEAIQLLQENNEEHQYSDEEEEDELNGGKQQKKHRRKHNKNEEETLEDAENEEIKLRAATLLLKKEYQKASDAAISQFNEHNLVDQSLLKMYNKNISNESNPRNNNNNKNNSDNFNQNHNTMNSNNNNSIGFNPNNVRLGQLTSELKNDKKTNEIIKKVQPVKISSQLGMLKGNLTKNSVLDVKNNKSRLSQFNDSFNKDQLLNEFGESALAKAFSTHADHSQAIFYSKNNSNTFGNNMNNNNTGNNNSNGITGKEDSNSKTLENKNAGNNNNNTNKGLTMKSQIPNLSKLFKASSSIAAGPSSNARMIFGRKREFISEEAKH